MMSEFTSGTYLATRKFGYPCVVIRLRSWGSATNRETWRKFLEARYSQFRLVEILSETPKLTANQPLPYSYQCSKILQNSQKLDSWAIHFDMILRSVNLFVIRQAINQIQNIGFGEKRHSNRKSICSLYRDRLPACFWFRILARD